MVEVKLVYFAEFNKIGNPHTYNVTQQFFS